jgi:hypothetical protein
MWYLFSTANMFAQTRLKITLYVHCLSFFIFLLCANKIHKKFSVFDCLTWSLCAGHVSMWFGVVVVRFTSQLQYSRERSRQYHLGGRLHVTQRPCGCFHERMNTPTWNIPRTSALLPKLHIYIYIYIYIKHYHSSSKHACPQEFKKKITRGSFHEKFCHYWFSTNNVSWSRYPWSHTSSAFTHVS